MSLATDLAPLAARPVQNDGNTTTEPAVKTEWPDLAGSDKQVAWASKIRASRIGDAELEATLFWKSSASRKQAEEFLEYLRSITRAHWWIETRTLGRSPFMLAALDEGIKARYVTPPQSNEAAHAVLAEATLAPEKASGPIAEVSLATGKVRVVLIEFDKDTNTLLKRCGYRWDDPAWTRLVVDDMAGHRAVEIAVRLIAHGCPVRIFDEALRQRVIENDYEPESPRRVEVSISEKYSTKFHLVWALDDKPMKCQKAARQLRGAKVFDDGAYVSASHFEDIQDFATQNDFTVTPEAQSLIDVERGKLAGSVRVAAHPKAAAGIPAKPALAPANGEIDAELRDN